VESSAEVEFGTAVDKNLELAMIDLEVGICEEFYSDSLFGVLRFIVSWAPKRKMSFCHFIPRSDCDDVK